MNKSSVNLKQGPRKTGSPSFGDGLFMLVVPGQGKGVFTRKPYTPGEKILAFGGELTHSSEITDFTHYLQIGPELYLGPSGSFDDFVNHHCDPNCAVCFEEETLILRSIRHISRNQQLSFDYSTILFNEPTSFTCNCGTPRCRQHIGNFFSLPSNLREAYLARGMVPLLSRYRVEDLGFSQHGSKD